MSLKNKLFSVLATAVMIFGSTPFVAVQSAMAAEGNSHTGAINADNDEFKPEASKTLTSNGDGTYTITLSVTGKAQSTTTTTKANVLVVFDTSGSMGDEECLRYSGTGWGRRCVEQSTRLAVAKSAVNSLAEDLLANNTTVSDMVEIALIDFSSDVNATSAKTTSLSTVKNWVNRRSADGGTNWEAALKAANEFSFGDDDKTYIVFVSDGNPTFRLTSHRGMRYSVDWWGRVEEEGETDDPDEYYWGDTWHDRRSSNVASGRHGTGNSDYYGWNLSDAKTQATAITTAGKKLYAVGAFGDATNMQSLGGEYYNASDSTTLNAAFSKIASQITNSLNLQDVEFDDGVTAMTQVASSMVDGEPTGFTYTLNGTEVESIGSVSLENNNVAWEVGDLGNGDVATLSFIVWPKQEAYDLIADLENGVKNYDDLTDEEKYQIEKVGDKYTLKTNTESPKLYYKTVETIDGVPGTPSAEKYITIANPDPVAVEDVKVPLRKIWNDSLDTTQRVGEITSVKLKLKKTNTEISDTTYVEIKDGEELIDTFEITDATTETVTVDGKSYDAWKYTHEIAIAPGEMISESASSYAALKATGKYAEVEGYLILDEGYDYTFEEIGGDHHFELEDTIYHPMVVDGELKSVVITRDENGNVTDLTIEDGVAISATNTLKGGINIVKKVVDENGNAKTTDEKFKIKAELKTEAGENYKYDYRVYTYNDVEHTSLKSRTGHICSSEDVNPNKCETVTGTPGAIEVEISIYDVVRVINIDEGTEYTVSEIESENPTGYFFDSVNYASAEGSADEADAEEYTDQSQESYTVSGNTAEFVTITNVYKTSKLAIQKVVEGEGAKTDTFNFNVKLYPSAEEMSDDDLISETSVRVKAGETEEITELPIGAYYVVEEDDYSEEGFSTSATGDTGTVSKDGSAKAVFTNTYSTSATDVQFSVRKKFAFDFDLSLVNPTFTFKLEADNDNARRVLASEKTIEMSDFTTVGAFGKINLDKAGEYKFKISEVNSGLAGYIYDETIYEATVTVEDNGYGELVVMSVSSVANEDGKYVVEFTNDYEANGSLEIDVEKILEGREWIDSDNFVLTVNGEEREVASGGKTAVWTFEYVYNSEEDQTGEWVYVISEKTDGLFDKGIEKETDDIEIRVNVRDNGSGELEVSYDGEVVSKIAKTITNVYTTNPTDADDFMPVIYKEIVDDSEDQTAEDTSFYFLIEGLSEGFEGYTEVIEVTTEGFFGAGAFDGISFDAVGEYEFRISEINDEQEYFEYDTTEFYVTVVVADDYENAKLYVESIAITTGDETEEGADALDTGELVDDEETDEIEEILFSNHYNEPGRGGDEPEPKPAEVATPDTGAFTAEDGSATTNGAIVASLFALTMLAGAVVAFMKKREA